MGSLLRIPSNSDFLGIIWLRVLAEELDFYTKLIAQSFTAAGISGQKWLELTFMPFRVMFSALESAISKTCLSLRISFPFTFRVMAKAKSSLNNSTVHLGNFLSCRKSKEEKKRDLCFYFSYTVEPGVSKLFFKRQKVY